MWRYPFTFMAILLALIMARTATWQHVTLGVTHSEGSIFIGTSYYPYLNGHTFSYREPNLQGWYWSEEAETVEWRIRSQGSSVFQVNNETLFENDLPAGEAFWAVVAVPLQAGANYFRLAGQNGELRDGNPVVAIEEAHPLLGWRLLNRAHLYPNDPSNDNPEQNLKVSRQLGFLRILLALSVLAWLVSLRPRWPRLTRQNQFWLAVFVLALIPRLILVIDRYQRDIPFHHLLIGGDNYFNLAYDYLAGNYSVIGSLWAPGNILWIGEWMRVAGPNILYLHLANALLGALMVVAVADIARRFWDWRTAKAAALILAFFPQLLFYQTSHLINSFGVSLTGFMLWLMVVYISTARWELPSLKLTWQGASMVILGLLIGFGGMFRTNLLVFALMLPLIVWMRSQSLPLAVWRTLPVAIIAFLTIAPMTPLNPDFGDSGFIVTGGLQPLHVGNNPTASGNFQNSISYNAAKTRGLDRGEAIREAFRDDPLRMFELYLRKIGLIWRGEEDGQLLDINQSGTSVSPMFAVLYRRLKFDLTLLVVLGLWGLGLIPYRRSDPMLWILPVGVILFSAATAIVLVSARLRVQLFLFLALTAAYALAQLTLMHDWRKLARAFGAAVLIFLILTGFRDYLPRPRFYSAPPADSFPQDIHYDGAIRLAAYESLQSDFFGGGAIAGHLFFERIGEVPEPYTVSVIGILSDGRILQEDDWILGCNGYPCTDPAQWKPGRLEREEFYLGIPRDAPLDVIRVGVILYTVKEGRRAIIGGNATEWGDQVGLVVGITPRVENPPNKPEWTFGGLFQLLDYEVSAEQVKAGESLQLKLDWMGLRPADENYGVFIHLIEDDLQTLHGQVDGNPTHVGIEYPTLQWGVNQLIQDEYEMLVNPDTPAGVYNLRIGFYSRTRPLRLLTPDGADGVILQSIEVTP